MDFLTQLFSDLPVRDSWLVLLFLLGAYLIGMLFAWLYWRRKWKAVKNELETRTRELTTLRGQYDELSATLEVKEADLKKANLEIDDLKARIRLLEEEKGRLHSEVFSVRKDMEKLTEEKDGLLSKQSEYETRLEDYDNQVVGLKTKNQALAATVDQNSNVLAEMTELQNKYNQVLADRDAMEKEKIALSQSYVDYDDLKARMLALTEENDTLKLKLSESNAAYGDYDEIRSKLRVLETENTDLKNSLRESATLNQSRDDYDALKGKIGDLSEENAELKRRLAALASELEEAKSKPSLVVATPPPVIEVEEEEESKEELAAKAQASVKAALGTKIKIATADEKDDLKLINGVGPFIEKKLNNLGIYTFEQISQFDDEFIEQVTDAIQFFPGRIQRDDWVGQAKTLLGKKNDGSLGQPVKRKVKPDDLKVVEGIGPKIEALLKDGGINTWAELAAAPVSRLQDILTAAGDRFKLHKPDTWPEQAGLAAAGKWDELDKLQDELNGGRKT